MSKKHHNLNRLFALFVAALQLVVIPATYTLHIGCDESHDHSGGMTSQFVSCFTGHHCSCGHHHTSDATSESPDEDSQSPHDSHSCQICHSAFALTTVNFAPLEIQASGTVSQVLAAEPETPESKTSLCILSRGPPTSIC